MEVTIFIVLGILYLLAFIVASTFPKKEDKETISEDYTYVKPKVIPNKYTDTDIQEKKKIFEECVRNGMTPFEAIMHCK